MNTSTKRSLRVLLYLPFWIFEWGALFLFVKSILFQSTQESDQNTIQFKAIVLIAWALSALVSKLYHYERNLTFTKLFQRYLLFCISWGLLVYSLTKLLVLPFSWRIVEAASFLSGVLILKGISVVILFRLRRFAPLYQRRILVYESSTGENFINDLQGLKRTGYRAVKVKKQLFEKSAIETLMSTIKANKTNILYIPFDAVSKKKREHIFTLSWNKRVELYFINDFNAPFVGENARFFGFSQVVKHYTSPLDAKGKVVLKRIFDIVFSVLVFLLLLSWFLPLMAILIRIDSKGPTFFIQKRPGQDGKSFHCFKFRSMAINHSTEIEASRDDARVTRVGKFIRKTSIDELPQFLNVLLGQMSVVGPRPNLNSQNDYYVKVLEEYSKRMYLKPGITGLAQVSGARGGIENEIEMKHRVKYDIFYIRNWSFALDIKIIIRTIINVFRGEEKAY